jgi:hypothetical protein
VRCGIGMVNIDLTFSLSVDGRCSKYQLFSFLCLFAIVIDIACCPNGTFTCIG